MFLKKKSSYLILEKGGDPNGVCKNNLYPPLVLAGHHGYFKVIKVSTLPFPPSPPSPPSFPLFFFMMRLECPLAHTPDQPELESLVSSI